MSLASGNQDEQAAYHQHTAFVGAEDSTLIFASKTHWMQEPEEALLIACSDGWTALEDMR